MAILTLLKQLAGVTALCLFLLADLSLAAADGQHPQFPLHVLPNNTTDGHATRLPLSLLTSMHTDHYTALANPRFPRHQVRVKKTNFCDPTVK